MDTEEDVAQGGNTAEVRRQSGVCASEEQFVEADCAGFDRHQEVQGGFEPNEFDAIDGGGDLYVSDERDTGPAESTSPNGVGQAGFVQNISDFE